MEKISFVVTVYNRLSYLRNIIFSLLNQTKMIDELIIADDGSKEKVIEYIADLIEYCPFSIKHVFQKDLGFRLARSRNNAARVAIGDFLIFVDQDVIFPDNFVESLYKNRKRKTLISSRALISTEKEKEEALAYLKMGYSYEKIYSIFQEDREGIQLAMKKDKRNNFLYRFKLRNRGAKIAGLIFSLYKSDFQNINGFDEKYIGWGEEDDDLCNRFYKYGGRVQPVEFKEYAVHLFHPFDPSKKQSPNREYYLKRKQEINCKNYTAEYGYDHTYGQDKMEVFILK